MYYDIEKSSERIRLLRMKSGLTQEKVATTLSIGRSFYSRIESGKNGCSVDLLIQLSRLFGVSIDYIVLGQERHDCPVTRTQLKADIEKLVIKLDEFKSQLE